jgi:hypothetical protein
MIPNGNPNETSISSLESLDGFLEYSIARCQLDLAFVNLTAAPPYFILPLRTNLEWLLKIKTLQQFLGNKRSDLAWKLESLFHNMFHFGAHILIVIDYPKIYKQILVATLTAWATKSLGDKLPI